MANVCDTGSANVRKIDRNTRALQVLMTMPDPCDLNEEVEVWTNLSVNSVTKEVSTEETDEVCSSDPCIKIPKELIDTYNVTAGLITPKSAMLMHLLYSNGGALEISNVTADINTSETFAIGCTEPCSSFTGTVENIWYYVDLGHIDYNNVLNNNMLIPRNVVITNETQGTTIACTDYRWSLNDFYPRIIFTGGVEAGDLVTVDYTYANADVCFSTGGRRIAPQVKFRLVERTAGQTLENADTCMIQEFDCASLTAGGSTYRDACSTDAITPLEITLSSKSSKICFTNRAL